jgi:hypothetical protein
VFDEQLSRSTSASDAAQRFAALWPIFRVSKLH